MDDGFIGGYGIRQSASPGGERMNRRSRFLLLLTASSLGACGLPQRHVRVQAIGEAASVVTYPAELRGAYVLKADARIRYCAEPAPDVALDSLQKLTAALKSSTASVGQVDVGSEVSTKVVQLAGRTELIVLAREMLYRACELELNNPSSESATQALHMYERVADLVENLGQAQRAEAEAELLRVTYGPDASSACIRKWLDADRKARMPVIETWLKKSRIAVSWPTFVRSAEHAKARSMFAASQQLNCD